MCAMALVQYYVASTIDGFIADSEDNIDWLLQFGFDNFQEDYDRFMADVGAIVMGSTTYEYIIREGTEQWAYGSTPVWVLTSRRMPAVPVRRHPLLRRRRCGGASRRVGGSCGEERLGGRRR